MTINYANIAVTAEVRSAVEQLNQLKTSFNSIGNELVKGQKELANTQTRWIKFAYSLNQSVDAIKNTYQVISSTVKSAFDFGKEMAAFESTEKAFQRYADSVGVSSESVLNKLKNASGGVIDNLRLMQSASNAMAKGVTNSADKMADLMMVANQKAKIFGKEGGQVFDELVNAIAKGSEKALAEVGIKLPDGFDKMTKGMTKAEKQAKILEYTIESGKKEIKAMGGELEDSSDSFARFDAAMKNLKTSAGTVLLPALTSVAQAFADTLNIVEDLIKSYKYLADPSLYNFDVATSKSLKGIKAIEEKELIKKEQDLKEALDKLEELKKPLEANNNINTTVKQYGYARENNNESKISHLNMTQNKKHNPTEIANLENSIKNLNQEIETRKNNISDLENKINDALTRENAQREKIKFTIENTNDDLDETNAKTKTTSANVNSIISKIDTLAKDKLPKLPETTSEMLDVSTEVLSVASLMPNYWFKTGENIDEVNKKLEETRKKAFEIYNNDVFEAFTGKSLEAQFKKQSNGDRIRNLSDIVGMAGSGIGWLKPFSAEISGVKTRQDIKETSNYMHDQFASGISNAIADGFASADFSGFASNLQSVISGVVGSGVNASISSALTKTADKSGALGNGLFKQVVNDKSKVSLSNLGSNLLTGGLIGTVTNFLFGEGGIFGKTKIVGKENLNKSAELNAQVDQAKELAESIYLATGISDYTRELIDNAVYNKTWTTTSKSKNLFKKKKTISLHGAAEAQASIKYVEDLQKQALGEQAVNNYNNYMLGRDNSVAASYNSYLDAQKAYEASQVMLYSDEEKAGFQTDIQNKEKRIKELNSLKNKKGKYSYYYTYYANNAINTLNNEITSLREKLDSSYKYDLETRTEMLQQMEEAHVNYINAQQDARSNLLSSFTGSSTLASLLWDSSQPNYKFTDSNGRKIYGSNPTMNMLLGNQEVMGNSDMIKTMLPLLEQSYMKDYDLNQRLNSSDENVRKEALVEQQSILEKALNSYEKIYKDAKDEALNTNLSTEEQSAAFERWQESFQAFLSLQEQIAENTKTIADIEESNALSKLSTELGDMLSVVAEIKNQKSTNNTLVFRQSMNVEEIIGKLKEIAGVKNPELASVLGEILDDKANASIWG